MAAKQRALTSNIQQWFKSNIHAAHSIYRSNPVDDPHGLDPTTCCYYTTHFILRYATRPLKVPHLTQHRSFDIKNDSIWYHLKEHVLETEGADHRMYHLRISNDTERRNGRSIHDFIIEQCSARYVVYQSCSGQFQLRDWLSAQRTFDVNAPNATPIYNNHRFGSGKELSSTQITDFINAFERHCNVFPLNSLVQDLNVAVYDLMDSNDHGAITRTMSEEQYDEQQWFKVKACDMNKTL